MTERGVTESVVEGATIARLDCMGWRVKQGLDVAPGAARAGRTGHGRVVWALVKGSPRRCWAASRRTIEG